MKYTSEKKDMERLCAEAGPPVVPALDTDAIMAAVRAEAAVRPVRRPDYVPRDVPRWFGALAASLAFLAALGLLVKATRQADREIGVAWARSVEPSEFIHSIMKPHGLGVFGGREP